MGVLTAPHFTLATTGTRWSKTTVDGFGRAIISESGYNTGATPTTVSVVKTVYTPCGCTPVGKLLKSSLPHAPNTANGNIHWTEHIYDALGRTIQVKQPKNSGTTTYSFAGPTVTVTDPAGKWKKYENDASGNLIKVNEPSAEIGGGADYVTEYTYSELGELLTVSMMRPGRAPNASTITQTRTWVYNSTTRRLSSVTHPESGTTSFEYYSDGSLQQKTDAKGQRHVHNYDADGRLIEVQKFANGNANSEDVCQKGNYYYGSNPFDGSFSQNITGRLAAVARGCQSSGGGQFIEMFSYNSAGAVLKKRLRVNRGSPSIVDKDVTYTYGSDGKLATMLYPGASVPYTYTYDLMDRPTKMTGPSMMAPSVTIDHARNVAYGVAGQVTGMEILKYEADQNNGTWSPIFDQSYSHDGFGSYYKKTMTSGSDVPFDVSLDQATNRINSANYSYDGNGNTLTLPRLGGGADTLAYDIDNRLVSYGASTGTEEYNYLSDNKRVWKKEPGGAEYVYFYGAGGQRIATYTVTASPFSLTQQSTNTYFGGKLIRADGVAVASDRLGSVMGRSAGPESSTVASHDYFPYGTEIGSGTAGNRNKFGTYHRDQTTGLDYADQRYFSAGRGRFLTPDPAGDGQNWYAYVGGDPVNLADPSGLGPIYTVYTPPVTVVAFNDWTREIWWDPFVNIGSTGGAGVKPAWWDHQQELESGFVWTPSSQPPLVQVVQGSPYQQEANPNVIVPGDLSLPPPPELPPPPQIDFVAALNTLTEGATFVAMGGTTPKIMAGQVVAQVNGIVDAPKNFFAGSVNVLLNDQPVQGISQIAGSLATVVAPRVAASVAAPSTLYHFTSPAGYQGIMAAGQVIPGPGATGFGVYATSIPSAASVTWAQLPGSAMVTISPGMSAVSPGLIPFLWWRVTPAVTTLFSYGVPIVP